ncbi:MAG: metal ABC transporter ATP-binding protein [Verrucomicrobia bacterium]|nr:metal ABC transporter ATP-binding protein [Verrucomicrobiota bacterium]
MKESILTAEDLTVTYEKNPVLWDLSFSIPSGVLVGIVGPNGAGKSTLLKAALGLVKPLSGKISFFNQPLDKVRQRIAYVPQRQSVDWDFPITALQVVLMGRYGRLGWFGRPRKADREAAAKALDLVGLSDCANRQISQLSGGQQQRLFLARAFVQNPDIFLMDEPFAGVDLTTEREIIDLLKKQKNEGKTIFIVHHDLPTVETYFDWTILLNKRLIACGPTSEVFCPDNLAKAFGKTPTLFDEAASLSAHKIRGYL